MIQRHLFGSACVFLGCAVVGCSGSEAGTGRSVTSHVSDASAGSASSAGGALGAGGRASAGGTPGSGGTLGTSGARASGGSSSESGGAPDAAVEAGACTDCFPLYDLHWGMDGGLTAFVEVSRIGPCRAYSHERTPTRTDPPSLMCNVTLPGCPARTMDAIVRAFSDAALQSALKNHTLYGNDPRPVDGQVFRISVGNDFIDVGPSCDSGCAGMPASVAQLAELLHQLDTSELAAEPCHSVFGG